MFVYMFMSMNCTCSIICVCICIVTPSLVVCVFIAWIQTDKEDLSYSD